MGGYFGRVFQAKRSVTQGGPLPPTIFNLTVDAVVRAWLMEVEGTMEITDACRLLACFYAYDRLIVARDPILLQRAFNSLCTLFDRVGLKTNTKKIEAMVFLPGRIRTYLSSEAYEAWMDDRTERSGGGGRSTARSAVWRWRRGPSGPIWRHSTTFTRRLCFVPRTPLHLRPQGASQQR